MAGNKQTGITTKKKHGADFYARAAHESQKAWRENGRKPRGFAAMSLEKRTAAARKGRATQLKALDERRSNRSKRKAGH